MMPEALGTGVSAPPAFSIRDYEARDESQVIGLLRLVLGEGRSFVRDTDFWRWKHVANPFGASQTLLAVGDELLGIRAFMRWGFRSPAGAIRAVRAVDTATHPGYRRLKVFSRLTQASLERARADGVHLIFNTPNPQSMAGYLKLGWQLVGRLRLLVRVLSPLGLLRAALSRRPDARPPVDPAAFVTAPLPSIDALQSHEAAVEEALAADDVLQGAGLRTQRSPAFLQWRYSAVPSIRYFVAWPGTPADGFIVFRPNSRRGLREIMLSEIVAGRGGARRVADLARRVAASVRADYLVAAGTPGTPHWQGLREAGFIPLPERFGPNLTVRPLTWPAGAPDPARLDSWRLSLGDLEIF